MGANESRQSSGQQQQSETRATRRPLPRVDPLTLDESGGFPIRLTPVQSLELHGLGEAKSTLTWRDVCSRPTVTFRTCYNAGVSLEKLHVLQPELDQWLAHGKVTVEDCAHLQLWKPNPFTHFGCSMGDLVMLRDCISPDTLVDAGVTCHIMWERYGLNGELMTILHYEPEDWLRLGITEAHLASLTHEQWRKVFGGMRREDMAEAVRAAYDDDVVA